MSEISRGVIGMPFKLAMGSEMSRRQFHACAQEVFVVNERLEAQVATLKADPNSWQSGYDEGRKMGTKTALSERDQLKAENEALRQQLAIPSDVLADCEALRLENEALRKALLEASEEVATWGAYANDYFQEKHDLAGCVSRLHDAAMSKDSPHD